MRAALPIHPHFRDLTGKRFSRLLVTEYAGRIGDSHAYRCRCDCGGEIVTRGYSLTGGVTRSCGCLQADRVREAQATHGLSHAVEWRIWSGMKTRCSNPKQRTYHNYGGLGVRVCDRWLNGDGERGGFECVYADMGPRPSPKHSIDRYPDPAGNYEPSNCRWATQSQQQENKREPQALEWNGVTRTYHEWARITGISLSELRKRLRRGWSVDRAMTQPMRRARR